MPAGMASGCIRSMELGTRLSGDCVAPAQLVNSCRPIRPYIENAQSQIDYCDGLRIATSPFSKGGLRGISWWSTIGTVLIFRHRKSLPHAGRMAPCMGPPFRGRAACRTNSLFSPPGRKGRSRLRLADVIRQTQAWNTFDDRPARHASAGVWPSARFIALIC